ncbi:hypothetical protein FM124_06520 [Pediococcus acidilactici]|nr:hypothetical protein FM124_06520 [Pediococcus acidilactici]
MVKLIWRLLDFEFAQFQLIHPQWVFGFENLNKLGNIST